MLWTDMIESSNTNIHATFSNNQPNYVDLHQPQLHLSTHANIANMYNASISWK